MAWAMPVDSGGGRVLPHLMRSLSLGRRYGVSLREAIRRIDGSFENAEIYLVGVEVPAYFALVPDTSRWALLWQVWM